MIKNNEIEIALKSLASNTHIVGRHKMRVDLMDRDRIALVIKIREYIIELEVDLNLH